MNALRYVQIRTEYSVTMYLSITISIIGTSSATHRVMSVIIKATRYRFET